MFAFNVTTDLNGSGAPVGDSEIVSNSTIVSEYSADYSLGGMVEGGSFRIECLHVPLDPLLVEPVVLTLTVDPAVEAMLTVFNSTDPAVASYIEGTNINVFTDVSLYYLNSSSTLSNRVYDTVVDLSTLNEADVLEVISYKADARSLLEMTVTATAGVETTNETFFAENDYSSGKTLISGLVQSTELLDKSVLYRD